MFLFGGSIFLSAVDILLRKEQTVEVEIVVMETSLGTIEIELNRGRAPITVENFVSYVEDDYFNGLCFHRVMKGFMIQGGGLDSTGEYRETKAPIEIESNNGLKNVRGAISMARSSDPNSATSQFFINTVNNDALDYPSFDEYGYTVFGLVISGMEVVDAIEAVETADKVTAYGVMADWPVEDIVIISATMKTE
ncbi:peptidyl-prolyl cis-trans isomerase [Candidatus Bathyarchaeota archaeon]|nr:peptidyl-prolyl cis-trans isomerase [Candidatus Bathyarchaeota archaeon]MBT4319874.1 peptidyl-prolyl cis-trans isomerase [Candidatus Bathyarchaeota archaeon]MBT4423970.1 peptidyl-prolyl cis-trans isomerase [Candidatus Bathyarchaeota archaeon]MBT5642008.1 peptidyl-prolyl cis-trans isomerase [Candidatus Bathyarchaeota archaeon]MBT6605675.1 peptidyl-prolyl cis-trans isomerase [Candidatus Bathyarchaeota archaeon]